MAMVFCWEDAAPASNAAASAMVARHKSAGGRCDMSQSSLVVILPPRPWPTASCIVLATKPGRSPDRRAPDAARPGRMRPRPWLRAGSETQQKPGQQPQQPLDRCILSQRPVLRRAGERSEPGGGLGRDDHDVPHRAILGDFHEQADAERIEHKNERHEKGRQGVFPRLHGVAIGIAAGDGGGGEWRQRGSGGDTSDSTA